MLAVIGITTGKGTTPSCDPYGTFLRTEGCNDIYADGSCGEYSVDNGSCACDGCDPEGTFLRTEGCNDIYADGCCGEYSVDNCDLCNGCNSAGSFESEGTWNAWANTVDADGTDWNITYHDNQHADGCCGTYSVRYWYAFSDTSPVELSSSDEGVSPNPPNGYVLVGSSMDTETPDLYTYATYAEDVVWDNGSPQFLLLTQDSGYNGNNPWKSYKQLADGSGGSTDIQTVQPAGTTMSDAFATFGSTYAKFYATGTTFNDGTNGSHPSFDIISLP